MHKDLVMAYVDELIEEVEESRCDSDNDITFGKLLAYNEVLSKLQRILIAEHPDAPVEYGLGFDIDCFIITGARRQLDWA